MKKTLYSLPKLYFYINSKRDITVNVEKLGYKTGKLKLDVRYLKHAVIFESVLNF